LYGAAEQQAVLTAWREVGVPISAGLTRAGSARGRAALAGVGREADTLAALTKQIEVLSGQVTALAKEVGALKGKK